MHLTQNYLNENAELKSELTRFSHLHQNIISPSNLHEYSWIIYNRDLNVSKSTYIFREKNNELLAINDGKVQRGNWEILPLSNSMLINDGAVEILYNIEFFCDDGFILRKENINEYLVLIKRNKNQLQTKPLKEVFAVFYASYEKIQRRFDNIDLEPKTGLLEVEEVKEFREYNLFPYLTILGAVLLGIAIIALIMFKFN